MKPIAPTDNVHHWPRCEVKSIECRRRDLVVRIADWSRQPMRTGEPSYDVEVYVGGVYDWDESKCCTVREYGTKAQAKAEAIAVASERIGRLL